MRLFTLFVLAACCTAAVLASVSQIENSLLRLRFQDGNLVSFLDKAQGQEKAGSSDKPIWEIDLVDEKGLLSIDSSSDRDALESQLEGDMLTMIWKSIRVSKSAPTLWVALEVHLADNASTSDWKLSAGLETEQEERGDLDFPISSIGLWSAKINVAVSTGSSSSTGQLFFPYGLGNLYTNPARYALDNHNNIMATYPSGGASMQFMAVADADVDDVEAKSGGSGVYVGTHDGKGYIKDILYSVAKDSKNRESKDSSVLTIVAYPENTGLPFDSKNPSWHMPYSVTVGLVQNVATSKGRPLHVEAAMIYRKAMVGSSIDTKETEWLKGTCTCKYVG